MNAAECVDVNRIDRLFRQVTSVFQQLARCCVIQQIENISKVEKMTTIDGWGPFVPALDPGELRARLRSLAAIIRLSLGRDGDLLARMVRCAEEGVVTLEALHNAIERLPSIPRRRIWAAYAGLTKPAAPCTV